MSATILDNAAWAKAKPRLSVLIPFHRDDPVALLQSLDSEAKALAGAVEIVVLDDGSGDAALAERIGTKVKSMTLPARFVGLTKNEGRSKGRNRLAASARAGALLFLDADMAPDRTDFLQVWLKLCDEDAPAAAFGGFSLDQASRERRFALHRAMALKSDCLPAEVRRLSPEKHVFTSNLLVRRDVFESEAFDEGFQGWGWEDVEWAMRVTKRHAILHIDNPATHLGLDPAEGLARKYEQSAANFARIVSTHHGVVSRYPSYRAARMLKRAPLRGVWRPALKALALADAAPLPARAFAMRLYRAALYAEAV